MVQRRAAPYVKGRYGMYESVTQMLEELTWVPLDNRGYPYISSLRFHNGLTHFWGFRNNNQEKLNHRAIRQQLFLIICKM